MRARMSHGVPPLSRFLGLCAGTRGESIPAAPRRAGRAVLSVLAAAVLLTGAPLDAVTGGGAVLARPAPDGFADLASKLLPAVVNVSTTQTLKSPDRSGPR